MVGKRFSCAAATYGYMDSEHIFSAAIVLVMINIAFPFNAQDNAAMKMALDVMNSMAEKGNSYVKARHQLLLNLLSMNSIRTSPPASRASMAPQLPTGLDGITSLDINHLLSQPANSATQAAPGLDATFSFEETTGDDHLWEEGYGNYDMDVDIDWTQWTEAAQNPPLNDFTGS